MRRRVAIVYNEPQISRYDRNREEKAVLGIMECVTAVHQALLELGDEVTVVPLVPPIEDAREKVAGLKVDVLFNLFEGFCGEPQTEALVAEALAETGVVFTGSRAGALRLALDKAGVKAILKSVGVPTPGYQLLNSQNLDTFNLNFPCMVKPRGEDASHGITADSVVRDVAALGRQVAVVEQAYNGGALVEEFLSGREFNATVMGDADCTVLPVSEIVYSLPPGVPRILTFAAKWETGSPYFLGTKVTCPAKIKPEEREYIAETARASFRLTGCTGYARVDMRMDEIGRLNVIEVNPNPDISPGTGAARQAKAAGMTYAQFVDKIIRLALETVKNDVENPPHVYPGQAGADANPSAYARV